MRPDTLPRAVTGVRMVTRGDGSLTIAWDTPENEGSALRKYVVRLSSSTGQSRTVDVAASTPAGHRHRAGQRGRAVGAGAGVERARRRAVRAVGDDAVGRHPARAARAVDRGERPRPGGRTRRPCRSRGSRAGRTARRSPAYTLYRSVDGGAWSQVARTSPDVRTARDVIPYDGRTYRYVATVTNGADLEGPQANPSSFTSNGIPSTPSVSATTPASNREIRLTVNVGQPRAAAFTAIRWSGGGKSGTHACGCAPGSQVVFSVGPFDTSPTKNYTITVWTVNSGGGESNRVSDSATPYGRHPDPDRLVEQPQRHHHHLAVEPADQRAPIDRRAGRGAVDQTFGSARTSVSSTARRARHLPARGAGELGRRLVGLAAVPDSQSIPNPPPEVYNVRKGPNRVDPNGIGSCTSRRAAPRSTSTSGTSRRNRTFDGRRARAPGPESAPRASPLQHRRVGQRVLRGIGRCLFADGDGPGHRAVVRNGTASGSGSAGW